MSKFQNRMLHLISGQIQNLQQDLARIKAQQFIALREISKISNSEHKREELLSEIDQLAQEYITEDFHKLQDLMDKIEDLDDE